MLPQELGFLGLELRFIDDALRAQIRELPKLIGNLGTKQDYPSVGA